jgi:hypothetical protein
LPQRVPLLSPVGVDPSQVAFDELRWKHPSHHLAPRHEQWVLPKSERC